MFFLETCASSYMMQIADVGHVLHLYYGSKIAQEDISYIVAETPSRTCFTPVPYGTGSRHILASLPQEFSTDGIGDYRYPSISVRNADGSYAFDGKYISHRIYSGKYRLAGLPSLYQAEDTVDTLELVLEDPVTHVRVELLYGVFEEKNVITRAVRVINQGDTVHLTRIMSVNLDFIEYDFDLIHFRGHHYMERMAEREKVTHCAHEIGYTSGTSSSI